MFGETAPRQDHEKLRRTSPPYSGSQKTGNSSYFRPSFHDEFLRHVLVYEIITTFFFAKKRRLMPFTLTDKEFEFHMGLSEEQVELDLPSVVFP